MSYESQLSAARTPTMVFVEFPGAAQTRAYFFKNPWKIGAHSDRTFPASESSQCSFPVIDIDLVLILSVNKL